MNKKIKILITIGGTGGHVFPGYNLAKHLIEKNYDARLVSDLRGYRYIERVKGPQVSLLPSSPINNKNFITKSYSTLFVLYSIFRSFLFLIFNRPKIIFGMGGYASFPVCIAASLLRIKFIIYENNLIIGKTNKSLLPFAEKMIVAFKELEGVPNKYQYKVIEIGNIIKKEIISFSENYSKNNFKSKIAILVLGGSQAAKIFAEILPEIFKKCSKQGINLKIYQHCLSTQNDNLKKFYEKNNIDYEIFNFSNNLENYFSKTNLVITRSGSSVLAELTNANLPFISVPLPTSAENHQHKNAIYYQNKNFSFLIEEKDLKIKLLYLIKEIYENGEILDKLIHNQRQYSDKNVYKNINQILENIIYEKN